jgi:hypothetical protein
LLQRIVPNIEWILAVETKADDGSGADLDTDDALPGGLWDPEVSEVAGGINRADDLDRGMSRSS